MSANPFTRLKQYLTDINNPFPENPISVQTALRLGIPLQTVADLHGRWRAWRHGPAPEFRVRIPTSLGLKETNIYRVVTRITEPIENVIVPPGCHLVAEVILYHPDGRVFELAVGLRNAQRYDSQIFDANLRKSWRSQTGNMTEGYQVIRESVMSTTWYMNCYERR